MGGLRRWRSGVAKIANDFAMTETIIPAFRNAPQEGQIVGRLLAGYSELEVEMLNCTDLVSGNIDAAVRQLYEMRGEKPRIDATQTATGAAYNGVELGSEHAQTMADMDWCRKIRNQYAHCQWYFTTQEGLCFIDLEGLAKQLARIARVTDVRFPVNVDLLSRQEAFFKHVQKWFWYLQEQYRARTGALRPSSLVHQLPPAMARPPLHN
jgi:hypothetical protein